MCIRDSSQAVSKAGSRKVPTAVMNWNRRIISGCCSIPVEVPQISWNKPSPNKEDNRLPMAISRTNKKSCLLVRWVENKAFMCFWCFCCQRYIIPLYFLSKSKNHYICTNKTDKDKQFIWNLPVLSWQTVIQRRIPDRTIRCRAACLIINRWLSRAIVVTGSLSCFNLNS